MAYLVTDIWPRPEPEERFAAGDEGACRAKIPDFLDSTPDRQTDGPSGLCNPDKHGQSSLFELVS